MLLRVAMAMLVALATPTPSQTPNGIPGFAMEAPEGWQRVTVDAVTQNLKEFLRVTPDELRRLLATQQRTVTIVTYSKEPLGVEATEPAVGQTEGPVLIPKITVNVQRNPTKTFDQFLAWTTAGLENLKKVLPGFTAKPFDVVQVGGRRAVVMNGTMDVPLKDNMTLKARSRTYFVQVGELAYQIDFTDAPSDDCTVLFDRLVATIRFD